jgi:hypothetical protein
VQADPVLPQTQVPLLQVSALLPQVRQAKPLAPHAVTVLPATQVPLEQQPPLQGLEALQAPLHVPLLHASSVGQSVSALQPQTPVDKHTWPAPLWVQLTQVTPPVPQVVALGVWHLPVLSQQPVGQLVASQTHLPLTQRWPATQGDPAPHVHLPPVQVSAVVPQLMQVPPLMPQALALVVVTQVLSLQQPVQPLLLLHVHTLLWQVVPLGHT